MVINNKTKATITYKVFGRASGPLLMEGEVKSGDTVGKQLPEDQEPYRIFTGLPCYGTVSSLGVYPALYNKSTVDFKDVDVRVSLSASTPSGPTAAADAGADDAEVLVEAGAD